MSKAITLIEGLKQEILRSDPIGRREQKSTWNQALDKAIKTIKKEKTNKV